MNAEDIIGYSIVFFVLGILFIVPAFIGRKLLLKRQAARKAALEIQARNAAKKPATPPPPASPRRMLLYLILFTLMVILWGLMTGFVSGIVAQIFPIVFLYPVVMGINSGRMIVDVIQRAKLQVSSQMIVLSLLSAVVTYGAYHYCSYLGFELQASMQMFEGLSEATDEQNFGVTKAVLDYALEEETGHSGFVGYMLYRAQEGMSIGRAYRSRRVNIGSALTWLYWVVEFGILLGITIQKGKHAVDRPFCKECGNWIDQEKHLGGTAPANEPVLLELIRHKDFAELERLVEKNADLPSVEVYFQGCHVCGKSQSQLVVRHAFQTAKGALQFTDASQTVLQPSESVQLLSQFSFSGD